MLAVDGLSCVRKCVCKGKELNPSDKKWTKYVLAQKKTAVEVRSAEAELRVTNKKPYKERMIYHIPALQHHASK
jgi:hypothetical protein